MTRHAPVFFFTLIATSLANGHSGARFTLHQDFLAHFVLCPRVVGASRKRLHGVAGWMERSTLEEMAQRPANSHVLNPQAAVREQIGLIGLLFFVPGLF